MNIESTKRKKTIIKKELLPDSDVTVYGATDRYGDHITFVSEEDHSVGEAVVVAKKPDENMSVSVAWKKSGKTIPVFAASGLVGGMPQIAEAIGPQETAKFLLKQSGLPESLAKQKTLEQIIDETTTIANSPVGRSLAVFSATFLLVFGLQNIWSPDKPASQALLLAAIVAAITSVGYYLLF